MPPLGDLDIKLSFFILWTEMRAAIKTEHEGCMKHGAEDWILGRNPRAQVDFVFLKSHIK